MAVTFNESTVAAQTLVPGVRRQRLLTEERVAGTRVLLDRISLAEGGSLELNVAESSLAWFQILEGRGVLRDADAATALNETHIVFLPSGFRGTLGTQTSCTLLFAEVPDAGRFDPGLASERPQMRVVDWTREPVLNSEHDARKRIYVATPGLFKTHAK
jgi:hypothetical protein